MGYWNAGPGGSSLRKKKTGMVWGDHPADIIDAALDKVYKCFMDDIGRPPTAEEIRSGLEFSLTSFLKEKRDRVITTGRKTIRKVSR